MPQDNCNVEHPRIVSFVVSVELVDIDVLNFENVIVYKSV
jgi:hypothetical protein